jgi:hypothetical protein
MPFLSTERRWDLLTAGAAALAAVATRQIVARTWNLTTGEDPPRNPESPETAWTEALTWTLVTSLVAGAARLAARRAAAKRRPGLPRSG